MKSLFSITETPAQKMVRNLGNIHDSNDDILRIIKLYNQGNTSRNEETTTTSTTDKYPYLLKYRASNLYILVTAAFSIFTSIYVNYSSVPITSYIIEHQIKDVNQPTNQLLPDEAISYILSSFHLFGLLGCQITQRKVLLIVGTLTSLLASGALMVSFEHWMLFPARFLQGLSNAFIWSMSFALVSDIWPISKLGSMFGFICGLYPLGMTFGLTVGDHKCSFVCILILSSACFILQLLVIERSTIPHTWLKSRNQVDTHLEDHDFKDMQKEMDVMEEGLWSKSSSLSTINLRDQPIIFKKESDYNYNQDTTCGHRKSKDCSTFYRLITSLNLVSLIYQLVVLSAITSALETALYVNLIRAHAITDNIKQGIVLSTFLVPCVFSSFLAGWFCDRFGSKIVSLTSVIILIPASIWVGVPNQNIESMVAALVLGGITMAGASTSVILVTSRLLLKIVRDISVKEGTKSHQPTTTIIFSIIASTCGIGYFTGSSLAKLNATIGFFWLSFIFAMLLTTCLPLMIYYSKRYKNNSIGSNISKKSIINNTRPESFAESILSDDTTVGSLSNDSLGDNVVIERKSSIIVIP
ncbi:hypothetical protein HPULCUR_007987 [Helicostylum pulchrum]|uniref:Major facilitator superfamily (MFS) profile domain-containing protein n=1 Tax=Helicostylum pulchrum TaxID=562976 RepID=A0ABP9Y7E8_9FUNG